MLDLVSKFIPIESSFFSFSSEFIENYQSDHFVKNSFCKTNFVDYSIQIKTLN